MITLQSTLDQKVFEIISHLYEYIDYKEAQVVTIFDYPEILDKLEKSTVNFYLHKFYQGDDSEDYIPLWKI